MKADTEWVRKGLADIFKSESFMVLLESVYEEHSDYDVKHTAEVYCSTTWSPSIFPCVELVPVRARRPDSDRDNYNIYSTIEIDCYYHIQGADEELLQTWVERYMRAVEDFFIANPSALFPSVSGAMITTGDVDYSPLTRFGDTEPFLKSGLISIFVRVTR